MLKTFALKLIGARIFGLVYYHEGLPIILINIFEIHILRALRVHRVYIFLIKEFCFLLITELIICIEIG